MSAFSSASASGAVSFDLADLGWDDGWAATLATAIQLIGSTGSTGPLDSRPARVARVDVGFCTLLSPEGVRRATARPDLTVAVGDWVAVHPPGTPTDLPVVAGALPRRTAIVRRSAGLDPRSQTLAANLDTVLVLVAADGRVTPRSV